MRLHRLDVEGFGPFRTRQTVDFDAFADDGIFLIAGRTGAGKSSILDAVCFGLYGGVPRYDGGEKRLRSDHCEPDDHSEVVVEFSTPAGRFRVTRSPEYLRPAKRGGGLTKQAAAVSLEEQTEDGWIGRAARAVDVAHELDDILQLSREQFLQVILLAQNRFSEFLLAGSRDRQALLRRLFGTERFEDVQARFDERKRTAEQELGTRLAGVNARLDEAERLVAEAGLGGDGVRDRDAVPDGGVEDGGAEDDGGAARDGETVREGEAARDGEAAREGVAVRDGEVARDGGAQRGAEGGGGGASDGGAAGRGRGAAGGTHSAAERLDALGIALARADYRAERRASERADAEARSTVADAALATVREDRRDQIERDRARVALARLDAEEPEIAQARRELANARAAEVLRPTIVAASKSQDALAQARGDEEQAEAAWRRRGIAVDDLEEWIAARVRETGGWERAALLEQEAPARTAEREAAERAVAAAEARAEAGATERDALPPQIAAITEEWEETRRLAARIPDLRTALDAADQRWNAAREVARLDAECAAADAVLTAATTTHAEAQTRLARLRQRRMDGMAGELAATLVDGEACAVCGSREHPAPAVHTDPVSADDIAEAEAERDAAARAEQEASAACTELQLARAAVTAQADGRDTTSAEAERAAAEEEHAQAVAAREQVARLEVLRAELAERAERLETERAEDAAGLAAAREQLALVVQRHQDAEAAIADARGEFHTVAERVEDLSARVTEARRLADARAERARRERAAAEAAEEREAALAASPFADAETAEQALRAPSTQEELEARISRHAVQREKERAVLFDLELRTLPEEPIDVEPFERASAEARAAWSLAVDEATRAAGDAARLAGLHESAAAEHARTAEDAEAFAVLQNLADTIAGRGANTRKMTLETFVLAAELEEIVEAANRRLHDMSEGRYRLQHSDALAARGAASGLGIVVADAFTGQTRPPQSLSGGETFLTSLALALGLAEVVTARAGGIRLDTLFIDEGFGSLDGDTLDVAMRTLDELRQGGRTVGVISHVEAMQEQIPAQLTVRALPNGPSVIETR